MGKEYVEAFFLDGSLRLPSFEQFRRHPDEARRDAQEGFVAMEVQTPSGPLHILGANGGEAYILCASTIESASSDHVAGIRIIDSVRFADAVSRQLPGFSHGFEGLCTYRDNTFIRKKDNRSIVPPKPDEDPEKWFKEQNQRTGELVVDAYFMKHSSFSHESEYRFIWFADGERQEFVDIKCPAAREFCELI